MQAPARKGRCPHWLLPSRCAGVHKQLCRQLAGWLGVTASCPRGLLPRVRRLMVPCRRARRHPMRHAGHLLRHLTRLLQREMTAAGGVDRAWRPADARTSFFNPHTPHGHCSRGRGQADGCCLRSVCSLPQTMPMLPPPSPAPRAVQDRAEGGAVGRQPDCQHPRHP